MSICLAASAGGHLSELLELKESWQGREHFYVTTSEVVVGRLNDAGRVYVVGEANRRQPLRMLAMLVRCIWVVLRERPDVVISTGAAAGCLTCMLAKMMGAKLIWIDSLANIDRLSMSGGIVRRFADLFLVQWEHLAERYADVEYLGTVL